MMKMVKCFSLMFCLVLFSNVVYAQYLSEAYVRYDSRYYPEFAYDRGGAEGHSGAYISIVVGVDHYSDLQNINVKAKHLGKDFEVTLIEDDPECVGMWPYDSVDQWFFVLLRPDSAWMKGVWEITLKYETVGSVKGTETALVNVPRFNFPPEPTGIQIADYQGKKWLVWNSIGDPGAGPGRHIEYRIAHYSNTPGTCLDKFYSIRLFGSNIYYETWSGNRIAVEIPFDWATGDLLRIENRVYDNNNGTVYRYDRGTRYFYMPYLGP